MRAALIRTTLAFFALAIAFCANGAVGAQTFTVTTTADSGAGSLREAITDANTYGNGADIQFDITTGSAPYVIQPLTNLPAITAQITIDGTTEPGATLGDAPLITLDGTNDPTSPTESIGLDITGGGTTVLDLNIRAFEYGVVLDTGSGNQVEGCFVGTDNSGETAVGSQMAAGIKTIDNSGGNTIGGEYYDERDYIDNCSIGVEIGSDPSSTDDGGTGNVVNHNYIGIDATGEDRIGNNTGVYVFSGTNTLVENNLISDNGAGVIVASGTINTSITANYVGTDKVGSVAVGNGYGIAAYGACSITNNLVSGNGYQNEEINQYAIQVDGDASGHSVVYGNKIGTDYSGSAAIPNFFGVGMIGSGDVIGGPGTGQGNIISGQNSTNAIEIFGGGATNLTIQGNYIGVGADGVTAIPNQEAIHIQANLDDPSEFPTHILIGGEGAGEGNIIANNAAGVNNIAGQEVSILGNSIYNDTYLGIAMLGNGSIIPNSPENSTFPPQNFPILTGPITPQAQAASTPASSTSHYLTFGSSSQATSSSNSGASSGTGSASNSGTVSRGGGPAGAAGGAAAQVAALVAAGSNRAFKIDMTGGPAPVSVIAPMPATAPPANFDPVGATNDVAGSALTAMDGAASMPPVTLTPALTPYMATVTGTLNSLPNETYDIEIFANYALNPSGNGDGQTYLGNTSCMTDGSGNGSFSLSVTVPDTNEQYFTATATDPTGNTSEFSNASPTPPGQPVPGPADIGVFALPSAGPEFPIVGDQITLNSYVHNYGPNVATNVQVTIQMPPGLDPKSAIFNGVGASLDFSDNVVTWTVGDVPVGVSEFISINCDCVGLNGVYDEAVTEDNTDPNTGNNFVFGNVNIGPIGPPGTADMGVTVDNPALGQAVGSQQNFTLFISNGGPATATNVVATTTLSSNITIDSVTASAGAVSQSGNTVTVTSPSYVSGEEETLNIVGTIEDDNLVMMSGSVTSDTPDPNLTNNQETLYEQPGLGPKTFIVTNTNDSGAGSLREALTQANSNAGPNTIDFDIPGTGPFTITPQGDLPGLFNQCTIDGYSQPGASPNTLAVGDNAKIMIVIDGELEGEPSAGITVEADNCVIKGLCLNRNLGQIQVQDGQVNAMNAGCGVLIEAPGATVQGCFLGTDPTGTEAIGNQIGGVLPFANNCLIGGPNPADRNIIADSPICTGTASNTTGIVIENNYIGTDLTGSFGLPYTPTEVDGVSFGNIGISVSGGDSTIGGTAAGLGNVISGNQNQGVLLTNIDDMVIGGNTVEGNFIGTDATGAHAVPNGTGVECDENGLGDVIGGTTGAGNVISGNAGDGVDLTSSSYTVTGNLIGTDLTGMVAVPNATGVAVESYDEVIGGSGAAANVISGNEGNGIVAGFAGSATIDGNFIGTDITGANPLPNGGCGISIAGSNSSASGNTIADNGSAGIAVVDNGEDNTFLGNSIFGNSGLGIDLGLDGVTQNHSGGGTSGNNYDQNYPVLTGAITSGGTTTISGTINTDANRTVTLEFFQSPTADQSGHGQGETSLGTQSVNTDGNGNATFSFPLATSPANGAIFSATCTGATGSTSEFSLDEGLSAPVVPVDTQLSMSGPAVAALDGTLTYVLTVTNNGPNPETGVSVTDTLPASLNYISGSATQGSVGISGSTVTATVGALAVSQVVTITIVTKTTATGTVLNTASATQNESDQNPGNNNASLSTRIIASGEVADMAVSISRDTSAPLDGEPVTYTITVTNNGPSTATDIVSTDQSPATYVSVFCPTGNVTYKNGVATFTLPSLAAGQSASYQLAVEPADGSLVNTATVSADQIDPVLSNNTAVDTTVIQFRPTDRLVAQGAPLADPTMLGSYTVIGVFTQNASATTNPATGVVLTYTIPAGCTLISTSEPIMNQIGNTLYFNAGNMLPNYLGGTGYGVYITLLASAVGQYDSSCTTYGNEVNVEPSDGQTDVVFNVQNGPYADLDLTGSVAPITAAVGGDITYTVNVTNLGADTASDVTVVATFPYQAGYVSSSVPPVAPLTVNAPEDTAAFVLGDIASGATDTFTVTVAMPSSGEQDAQFTANAFTIDPNLNNNTVVLICISPTDTADTADVSTTITGPSPNPLAGTAVPITLTATNNGPASATGVVLMGTVPNGVNYSDSSPEFAISKGNEYVWDVGTLTSGQTATYTMYVDASADGTYNFTSTVYADQVDSNVDNNTDSVNVTFGGTASADVSISESGPANVLTGDNMTDTLTVTNNGPDDATDVVVQDSLPFNLTFVDSSPVPTTNVSGALTFDLGTLASGDSAQITITGAAQDLAPITNSANVSANESDPNLANNNVSFVTQVAATATADVGVTDVAAASVATGANITDTITVSDLGPSDATGVVLTDNLPSDVTFVSSIPSPTTNSNGVLTYNIGTVTNGSSSQVTVTTLAGTPGLSTNTASVTGTLPDPETSNNNSSAQTTITGVTPDTALSLGVAAPASVAAGAALDYTFTVTNGGPNMATGVTLADPLPSGVTYVSSNPTPASTANGVLVFNIGPLANGANSQVTVNTTAGLPGQVSNTGTVYLNETNTSANNSATANTTINTPPPTTSDLGVTVSGETLAVTNADVAYAVTVTNAGPDTAAFVTLTYTLPSQFSFVSATISQGGGTATSITPSVSGSVLTFSLPDMTAAPDVNSTVLLNVVVGSGGASSGTSTFTAASIATDPDSANNTASITTAFTSASEVDEGVTVTGPTFATTGSNVTYTVTLTDEGDTSTTVNFLEQTLPTGFSFVSATETYAGGTPVSITPTVSGTSVLYILPEVFPVPESDSTLVLQVTVNPGTETSGESVFEAVAEPYVSEPDETANITTSFGAAPTVTVSPGTLPAATVAASYSQTISATGGNGPYTFAVTSGSLPAGLTLNSSTGVLSGTPTAGGPFSFTITATDSTPNPGPYTGSQAYTFTVNPPTITLLPTTPLPGGNQGVAYSQTVTASGGTEPYTYAVTGGNLPPSLTLNGSTGVLSGTPTSGGFLSFTITATDSSTGTGPYTGSKLYNLVITAINIVISPGTLPAATVASSYSQTVSASGGNGPYTFAITSGSLPAGLTLNTSTGVLSGTPTAGGPFSFTITATDSTPSPGPYTGSQAYTLTVNAPTITVSPVDLPNGTDAIAYTQTVSASGGTESYSYTVTAGNLPPGLNLSRSTGVLSGTPTSGGFFSFTITATDSSTGTGPYTGSEAYNMTVFAPTIVVSPSTLPGGTVGIAYNQSVSATGGITPYSWSVTAGSLPTGLNLNTQTGAVSGTPTAGGTFNFTITATDSSVNVQETIAAKAKSHAQPDSQPIPPGPYTGSEAYTVTIAAPTIVVSPSSLPDAVLNVAYSQTITASGGTPPYTFAVTAGSLPPGLTLYTETGALTGTPTTGGNYPFTVTATDSSGVILGIVPASGASRKASAIPDGEISPGPYTGSQAYTLDVITAIAPAPVISPNGGTYNGSVQVTITDSLSGATILFTTDGTNPATSSTARTYTGAITLVASATVTAVAEDEGYENSSASTAGFTIVPIAPPPTITPDGGTFAGSVSVTLADTLSTATILYTTDGSDPATSATAKTYTAPFTLSAPGTVTAVAEAAGYANSPDATASFTVETILPPPTITPDGGTFDGSVSVTLSDSVGGVTILYTTDGSNPATSGTVKAYTTPFTLTVSGTVTAIATAAGYANSASSRATFTVLPIAPAPTITPNGGSFNASASVSLADALSGAKIVYTTDGSNPATSATAKTYAGAFTLAATATVTAIAEAAGYANSSSTSAAFTITPIAPAPVISPDGGSFTAPVPVTLTDSLAGATIVYTIDGSNPSTSATAKTYSGAFTLSSTATVSAIAEAAGYADSAAATALFTITLPLLDVTVTGPASTPLSAPVTYVVTVTNNGATGATTPTLSDAIPPGYTFVSATISQAGGSATPITPVIANGTATFTLPTIATGAQAAIVLDIVETAPATEGSGMSTFTAASTQQSGSGGSPTAQITTTAVGPIGDGNDVTGQTSRTAGSIALTGSYLNLENGAKVSFTQTITVKNTSSSAINGPIQLVLDNLRNATLLNLNGFTTTAPPLGSPYILLPLGAGDSLAAGASVTVTLEFLSNDPSGITYTTRVLAGSTTIDPDPVSHEFPAGLQMISAPYDYASVGVDFTQILQTDTPKVAVYEPGLSNYAIALDYPADTMRLGQGYWVRLAMATPLQISAPEASPSTPFSESLPTGWNQIGDPFPSPEPVSSLAVTDGAGVTHSWSDAVALGLVSGTLYAYNPATNAYVPVISSDSLAPYAGYWLYADAGITLTFPN